MDAIAQDLGKDPVEVRKMLVEVESAPLRGEGTPEEVANVVVFPAR